jgi:NAD(P)-dependent dehydrogenase (short-subunit alcohol dehydrogenase family)
VDVFVGDLSSQAEVRLLAGEVLERVSRIDVLVNNVGGYWNTRHVTADGLERTFALNHLAPFLLTSLLLDRLKESGAARVVTNVMFSYELARSLAGTSVTANALHPGVVRTGFGGEDPGGVQRVFTPFMRPFMKAPVRGAATSIHVACDPDLAHVTGRYFANSKPKRSAKRSYDEAAATRLWRSSAELVGMP